MRKFSCLLWLVGLVLAIMAGCSSDQQVSPTGPADPQNASEKAIGPSEIVLCLDVSDSISAGELTNAVSALGTCLANPELIPTDGNVAIALVVYGDGVATPLVTPIAANPDNVQQIILPALQGLLLDRQVATAGFDLGAALDSARTILEPSTISDRHVLIIGSGSSSDEGAVQAACLALSDAGVMVSALALGADVAGAALLAGCANATGGFSGQGEGDLTVLCADALAYMLLVQLDLQPATASLTHGQIHAVTATVYRGSDPGGYPLSDREVSFAVIEGPNAPLASTASTDADGLASFSYTGAGGVGVDTIVAETLHPGTGAVLRDTVTVSWTNTAPACDAGGPYAFTLDADSLRVMLDGSHSLDADGDPLTFAWSIACEGASFDDATAAAPVLVLTGDCLCQTALAVELAVSDGFDTSTCQASISIDDQRPPVVEMQPEPLALWPPNHKYHVITPDMVIMSARDACGDPIDPQSVALVEIRSDEPEDAGGQGDGHTLEDIVVVCPNRVQLRAERAGGGDGRVYTIVYRISGDNGISVDSEALVVVPHDASGDPAVLDEGAGYAIVPDCDRRR